jgi:hypothetical protein
MDCATLTCEGGFISLGVIGERDAPLTLTVHIPDVLTARDTTTDPAICSDLRNKVLGILDIVLEHINHRGELVLKGHLSDSATLLAEADLLGMLEEALHIRVTTPAGHKGNGEEGAGLLTDVTAVALELGLVTEERIGINGSIIEPIALAGIHKLIVNSNRIHAGCVRDEVCCDIMTRASRLGIERLEPTHIILGTS